MRAILKTTATAGLLLAAAIGLAAGCGAESGPGSSGVSVSASTTHLADLADNVAGERAEVRAILGPNADPHEYEPRPSDAEALLEADLILRSGGDLDLWLDDLTEGSGTGAPVLDALAELEGGDPPSGTDPHWWQDPIAAIDVVEAIRDRLSAADPEGAGAYAANAAAYVRRLRALDRGIAACMGRVPAGQRRLITSHDSLGRYADRYGIEVIGAAIPALSTQAQPSAGETAELVELIGELDVRAVFPEAGVSAELEEAIAADAGAVLGGELWADALGPAGSGGETYIQATAANTAELVAGFTGGEQRCDPSAGDGG